jgi:hypothetical protein
MSCLEPNTVLALVDGRLLADALSRVQDHLAGCQACADLVAAAAGAVPAGAGGARLEKGSSIGRYVILDLVGRGGMGEVYAAYDPQLDRKVALKLLRWRGSTGAPVESARARLLREAKAIARLSHPNVVVVYDAGEIDGRVFLAMEFVEGQTLASWLDATPKTWRSIRDVFVAAGNGLAAAHEAGLVHRDFKPQNVMVGKDGAVRVMDFGLARDASDANAAGPLKTTSISGSEVLGPQAVALTDTGVLLGTPLYMAPEQLLGRSTDPRTDQFSFSVALYHALYGERPFPSGSHAALVEAVTSGRIREPPQKARVPRFLRRTLMRGLRPEPSERFESMPALLEAVQRDPARQRRKLGIGVAAAAMVTILVAGVQQASTRGHRLCRGGAGRLNGVWELAPDGQRRNAVHNAFAATGRSFAEETWPLVSGVIDDWSRRWTSMYTDACEGTHVRGDQSAEVLDLRMACLEEARGRLRSLTDVLARSDARVLIQAVSGAQALPALDRCANSQLLRAVVAPPADPAARKRVDELKLRLADVKALADTGQVEEARRKASLLLADARATGYLPLQAETLEALGMLDYFAGDIAASSKVLEEAVWTALSARREDLAVKCAGSLVALAGFHQSDAEQGKRWERLGRSLLDRLGSGQEQAAAWLMHGLGITESLPGGDPLAGLADLRAGLALKRKILPPDHFDIAISWDAIALAEGQLGNHAGALDAVDESLRIYQRAFGRGSPRLATPLNNRGEALMHLGRYAEAEHDLSESLERYAEYVPVDHPWVAYPLTALGTTLLATDRAKEALPVLERALQIREHAEPTSDLVAETRFTLARALWETGTQRARARMLAATAGDTYNKAPSLSARAAEVKAWLEQHRLRVEQRHRTPPSR